MRRGSPSSANRKPMPRAAGRRSQPQREPIAVAPSAAANDSYGLCPALMCQDGGVSAFPSTAPRFRRKAARRTDTLLRAMTAKDKLRQAVEELTELEAEQT